MTKEEIQKRIDELKSDYIRIQGDMEKLESLGKNGNVSYSEKLLEEIELELKQLRELLYS
ncbi:SE1832 family protein [Bacillus andreraoultii]|uniref:SE1832 family protein n=1 Tax=Bacillus andreraoultii TaxID=1499685 RepID=UPI00053B5C7B|nr:SE1832 family protein [Bacillus andreraoultii]